MDEIVDIGEEKSCSLMGNVRVDESDREDRIEELRRALRLEERSPSNVEIAQLRQIVENYDDVVMQPLILYILVPGPFSVMRAKLWWWSGTLCYNVVHTTIGWD